MINISCVDCLNQFRHSVNLKSPGLNNRPNLVDEQKNVNNHWQTYSTHSTQGLCSRLASHHDIDAIMRIEHAAWPRWKSMRTTQASMAERIHRRLVHASVDERSGRILGYITLFRPRWARHVPMRALLNDVPDSILLMEPRQSWKALCWRYGLPTNWHEATNDGDLSPDALHDPHGTTVFGVSITTDPSVCGRGIAHFTLHAALEAVRRSGISHFMAYGRLPGFAASGATQVKTYMANSAPDGGPADVGFRIHWKAGARPLRSRQGQRFYMAIPDAMPCDRESRGWGFLATIQIYREHRAMSRLKSLTYEPREPSRFGEAMFVCPPTYFDVEYSINPWMDPSVQVDKAHAWTEWKCFVRRLRAIGVEVREVAPAHGCPDMVFLGDAGLVYGHRFLCSRFRHPERQPESDHYAHWFAEAGFQVELLPRDVILEGYGDIVNFREMAVLGYGKRSNRMGLDAAMQFMRPLEVVAEVRLPDPRFYHLAAALTLLDHDTLLYYPPAFLDDDAHKLSRLVQNAIVVSKQDIYLHQACNAIAVGDTVFMDGCSDALRRDLDRAGFGVECYPVGELKKGGGSLKCLVLPVVEGPGYTMPPLRSQGRYEEAEPLDQQDIAITKKVLGDEHPDFATSLNN